MTVGWQTDKGYRCLFTVVRTPSACRFQECFQGLNDNLMVFVLLQPTHHDDGNNSLHALDPDWNTSAMDSSR